MAVCANLKCHSILKYLVVFFLEPTDRMANFIDNRHRKLNELDIDAHRVVLVLRPTFLSGNCSGGGQENHRSNAYHDLSATCFLVSRRPGRVIAIPCSHNMTFVDRLNTNSPKCAISQKIRRPIRQRVLKAQLFRNVVEVET